jgi:choline kinase
MRAVILAAGRGERLHPYTHDLPKCQLPFAGRTLLEWQLSALRNCGVSDISIVTGHARGAIPQNIKQHFNADYLTTNMVASLFRAETELSGPCLVCYSDIIYEPRLIRTLLDRTDDIDVIVDTAWLGYYQRRFEDPYAEAESLVFGANSSIIDIGRSRPKPADVQGQYVGLIRLSEAGARVFVDRFHTWRAHFWEQPWIRGRSLRKAFMTDFLQALINDGVKISGVPVEHGWLEFDSRNDYHNAQSWHLNNTLGSLFTFEWATSCGTGE